ncbi:MAG: HAD family hydrolase [Gammaproteobacteria bacterium]|nr:HAD family hydrolase [Gammaproteobacteria bacterium]
MKTRVYSFFNSNTNPSPSLPLISVMSVSGKKADRTQYANEQYHYLESLISRTLKEVTQAMSITFSLDKIKLKQFKKIILPIIISSFSYASSDYVFKGLSQASTQTDDYDFVFKFLMGSAIITYSSVHRLTENKIASSLQFSMVAASELLAATYLYTASFAGSRKLLEGMLSNSYSLLYSLAASSLVIPGVISYTAQKYQQLALNLQYKQGAQRSDTALIASGLTPIANTYLIANALLTQEIMSVSRTFQLGLIANNILNDKGWVRQLRNLPAMLIDIVPQIVRKMLVQLQKIEHDYVKNTHKHYILKFNQHGSELVVVNRYELRSGDLVWCGNNFDPHSVPLSGEIFSFKRDEENAFTNIPQEDCDFRVNLKMYTGENIWFKCKTANNLNTGFKNVDQKMIQEGKQLAILDGAEIDFCGHPENFFVRVARKKEIILDSSFEKKSMINSIINQYKQNNILYALALSASLGMYFGADATGKFTNSVRLLFSLFQMIIPFSESFLREMINSKMLKEMNKELHNMPLESVDALRVVDLCNVMGGYYPDKFPKGAVIVSDKTGTLTTTKMKVDGYWTSSMPSRVQKTRITNEIADKENYYPSDINEQIDSFETFCLAFTNNEKELEPEEHAILKHFKKIFNDDSLMIERVSNNHFKKTIKIDGQTKHVETIHLGLFLNFGGRLTIVSDKTGQYFVFCGIPKSNMFADTPLLNTYEEMTTRTGILSRDWCIAKTVLSSSLYTQLLSAHTNDDKESITKIVSDTILKHLKHVCTFLIDNPVKDGVQDFIPNCNTIGVPVLVATGDTAKAAHNIAKVLCASHIKNIHTIKAYEQLNHDELILENDFKNETVVFAGINNTVLRYLDILMSKKINSRPTIIFAEMSTQDKGMLARFLKAMGYFVIANGDGTNDIAMMKAADLVFAHTAKDGSYAPGVRLYANINDVQVRKLTHSNESFYHLFDIHRRQNSLFMKPFIRIANVQEMPSYVLIFKSIKIGFELMKALGYTDVEEIWQQHLLSIAFDLIWLWVAFTKINQHSDLPVNNEHIARSNLPIKCMMLTLALATMESFFCYAAFGKTTDITLMILKLSFLSTLLTSFLSGFRDVQREEHDNEINVSAQRGTLFNHPSHSSSVTHASLSSASNVKNIYSM